MSRIAQKPLKEVQARYEAAEAKLAIHYDPDQQGVLCRAKFNGLRLTTELPSVTCPKCRLIAATPDILTELKQAERVIRHAAQEAKGRVSAELVGGWIYHANKIQNLIAKAEQG